MKFPIYYSNRIDSHIYLDDNTGCECPEDWLELAIAALDQAGMSEENQEKSRKFLIELLENKKHES